MRNRIDANLLPNPIVHAQRMGLKGSGPWSSYVFHLDERLKEQELACGTVKTSHVTNLNLLFLVLAMGNGCGAAAHSEEAPTVPRSADEAKESVSPSEIQALRATDRPNIAPKEEELEEDLPVAGGEDPFADSEIQIDRRPEPLLPPCACCESDGRVPLETADKPYVLFEGEEALDPLVSLGWKPCDQCVRGQRLLKPFEQEQDRTLDRRAYYKKHEEATGLAFVDFETRHLSGHFQTSPEEARACALILERLAALLRKQCGDAYLVCSPDKHHLVVCETRDRYQKYITWLSQFTETGEKDWLKLALESASFGTRFKTVIRRDLAERGVGLNQIAVFSFAQMQVKEATHNNAPGWFAEGFSSLCESLLFPKPRCYTIRYEKNDLQFEDIHWSKAVARSIQNNKARKWETLFRLDNIGMSVLDYQQCWSTVAYLFSTDRKAFAGLAGYFGDGSDTNEALEKAFKKPLSRLESDWRSWALKHDR